MLFERSDDTAADWNELATKSAQASLIQCAEYGEAKAAGSAWAVERGRIVEQGATLAMAQVLVRKMPLGLPGGVAWINRAPIFVATERPDDAVQAAAINAIVHHYAEKRGLYLRLAAPIPKDEFNTVLTSPGLAGGQTFKSTQTTGWASARLDLTRPEDELYKNLRGNWRSSLRKAEKLPIEIEIGSDETCFGRFIDQHRAFLAERNYTTSVTPDFLQQLQRLLPPDRKLIALTAKDGAEILGSVLIAGYGGTCEYLAGNASSRRQGVGVGQLLLWRAIIDMKRRGFAIFDVGGMDSERTPKGIFEFKAGVNPIPYRLANEIEAGDRSLIGKATKFLVARAQA